MLNQMMGNISENGFTDDIKPLVSLVFLKLPSRKGDSRTLSHSCVKIFLLGVKIISFEYVVF